MRTIGVLPLNVSGSTKRWEMHGKKENEWALIASENRLMASLTCFGKLMLHRALSCWLQLPDCITLWPQFYFIALTSIGQVVSSLTEDLHFTAVLNVQRG